MSENPIEYSAVASPVGEIRSPYSTPAARERKKPGTGFLVALPLVLGFVGALLGGVWGLAKYVQSPSCYESEVVLSITPRDPVNVAKVDHATRIKCKLMIQQCLARAGGKLRNLSIFDDTPTEEIADFVQRNLVVESLAEDSSVISVRFISSGIGDSPTILNNLALTYEESLIRRSDQGWVENKVQLRMKSDHFKAIRDFCQQKIRELQGQIKSSHDYQSPVQDLQKQIQALRSELRKKNHLSERVKKALESDKEIQADMVWMLRERGHSMSRPSATKKQDDAKGEKADETTDQNSTLRRFASLVEDEVQALQHDVEEDTELYEKLDAESLKVSRIKQELAKFRSRLDAVDAELAPLNFELGMYDGPPDDWRFERLANALEGKQVSRGSVAEAMRLLMFGLLGGLFLGVVFAIVIK